MKTISIINLKGGVAKTISAINICYMLTEKGYRVLLIDCDKQGNSSKFFKRHGYDKPSLTEVLTARGFKPDAAIQHTFIDTLDILPANMSLLRANRDILTDVTRPQQSRLKRAMDDVAGQYDYCVIDCAPDINMATINALVATDDVLIPVKVDAFVFDGMAELLEQIDEIRDFNPSIRVAGCFLTMYNKTQVNTQARDALEAVYPNLPVMQTVIRRTTTVDKSTFRGVPLQILSPRCTAAVDYNNLVNEYLNSANN